MQIKWLGHASFELKIEGLIVYIDPYDGEYEDKADIILITHAHYDHFSRELVDKIRKDNTTIIGTAEVAAQIDGCRSVREGEKGQLAKMIIHVVPAYNTPNAPRQTHSREQSVGYIIEAEERRIYHAGDTSLIPEMKNIKADIVLLPVGGTYTMNAKEAASAAKLIKPKIAVPMHYGKIVGTQDDAELFKEILEEEDIEVRILAKGEWENI